MKNLNSGWLAFPRNEERESDFHHFSCPHIKMKLQKGLYTLNELNEMRLVYCLVNGVTI